MKCPVGKYCDAETGTIEPTDCPKKSYNPVENGDVRKNNIILLYCRVTATILFLNFFILFFCNLNDHIFWVATFYHFFQSFFRAFATSFVTFFTLGHYVSPGLRVKFF